MKREDKFEVNRHEYVSEYDGKTYIGASLIIKELYGYGALVFKDEPLEVFITIEKGAEIATYSYDFGMDDKIGLKKTSMGFMYDPDPVIVVFNSVKFDLQHAFNHIDMDPNFNHTHWALRSILADRVIAYDWWEEAEVTEQPEFDFLAVE